MNKRENGFYWVKYNGEKDWEPAQYSDGYWYFCGSDVGGVEEPNHWASTTINEAIPITPPPT